ncbi:ABC transporter transmembrane region [Thermoclostridium stercorarium subsp. stercorarium DSM 8532]|jgi:ATP-binding cassette subfamily B multidrug efflux pump|uniref:ABC transporter transmembrane region n=3 Tax=Thermoclostridium stercorarium TaxID=1510 RepID=L7VH49_THES1|nr:ABC transporter ATP-binding protein [Thermoclostridium stercorarium]AGC67330.1 ABC transporter transmembrane region [Thermoclostridium stercorarium subsp. stercorarium DSM 8532]AGI38392.1 ABC transporter ATPase/permease subunit [Thermoclostridium stercorarium subsp. stercorarium DSM 8532]ANW97828.1 multidrug ABC transporter ATP-binding protein [Thermoclostridium stercorarium subsp. thermolacticum DSM 2910]ANX00354.1 multidrug ABC transporter ATP-binding protein [Thermoclostridium stercorariu
MARNKFDVDETLETEFNIEHIKRLWTYIRPYKKELFTTLLMMILSNLAVLLGPYLLRYAINSIIPAHDTLSLILVSLLFLFSIYISMICLKYRIRMMSQIAQNVILNLRRDLFVHLQKLSFNYYDNRPHGKIIIRVVNYVNSLNDLLQNGIINMMTDLFSLVLIIGFMLSINVRLTLVSLTGVPVLVAVLFILKKMQRERWQKVSRKQSNMNAYLHETINGMKVTQSFVREEENEKIYERTSNECRTSWISAVRANALLWPITENISVLTISLMYIAGVVWIANEDIAVGDFIAFASYISNFWAPITNLGNFYNQIIQATAYLERIFETLDEPILIKNAEDSYPLPPIKGEVEFKNVVFCYEKDIPVLKNVSFKVNPGETIALVGATGSGKTTIINLLSRFYDIQSGQILIDGHDIKKVTLESLRSQVGVMLQDTFIFSGTVMDNIRYGKPDATDEEVIQAAKEVMAHDFIMEMENGYYTEVNERGSRLSVGQRQLISFARTLLSDPKILILDEATSSIDTKTEKAIQIALERLLKGRTAFIIAHRLSTIKNADRILHISHGRITEAGTHEELMKLKGDYYKLYMSQYKLLHGGREAV